MENIVKQITTLSVMLHEKSMQTNVMNHIVDIMMDRITSVQLTNWLLLNKFQHNLVGHTPMCPINQMKQRLKNIIISLMSIVR